jgi:hypothetical protein
MRVAVRLLVAAALCREAISFSTGAGSCSAGNNAVQGIHLSNPTTGSLGVGGFTVSLAGATLVEGALSVFPINTDAELIISGGTFRGFLARLGETGVETDTAFSFTSADVQKAAACVDVGGVTHTSNSDKTTISAILNMATDAASMPLDVTVVVQNSGGVSEYYYSQFLLAASDGAPAFSPTSPVGSPVVAPGSFSPVVPPTIFPTAIPPTAYPTGPTTPSVSGAVPTAVIPSTTYAPFAPVGFPTRGPSPSPSYTPPVYMLPTMDVPIIFPTRAPSPAPSNIPPVYMLPTMDTPIIFPTRAPSPAPSNIPPVYMLPTMDTPIIFPTRAPSPAPSNVPPVYMLPTMDAPFAFPNRAPAPSSSGRGGTVAPGTTAPVATSPSTTAPSTSTASSSSFTVVVTAVLLGVAVLMN